VVEDRAPLAWIAVGTAVGVIATAGVLAMVLTLRGDESAEARPVQVSEGAAPAEAELTSFADDFEGGLSQWRPRTGALSTELVSDPVGARGTVVRFGRVIARGDMSSPAVRVDPDATYVLSFRYLGMPTGPVPPGGLGGFIGVSDGESSFSDHAWIAGTEPGQSLHRLDDDGTWHSYSFEFVPSQLIRVSDGTLYVIVEDFEGSGRYAADARPGDAYFDDVRLERAAR